MVEGGSELLGSFLAARAFDQLALFRAPLLLGGRGQPACLRRARPRSRIARRSASSRVPADPPFPGVAAAVELVVPGR